MKFNKWFLLLLGYFVVFIGISYFVLKNINENRGVLSEKQFEQGVSSFFYTLERRYDNNQTTVEAIDGFFVASEFVSLKEWKDFVGTLKLSKRFPGIGNLGFIKRLDSSNKPNYLQKISTDLTSFKIWPEEGEVSFPIVYVFPSTREDLVGYNLYLNEHQRKALEESAKTMSFITIDPIYLNPSKVVRSERMLCLPIQGKEGNQVYGWVFATIDFATIIEQVSAGTNIKDWKIDVYLGEQATFKDLIFQKGKGSVKDYDFQMTRSFEFAGTKWTFLFGADVDQTLTKDLAPTIMMFIVLFVLTFAVVIIMAVKSRESFASGDGKGGLEHNILSCAQYAFIATDLQGKVTYFNPAAEKLLGYSADEMVGKLTPEAFHDPDEIATRAKELTNVLGKEIQPGFGVFIAFAEKDVPETRRWTYIRKDKSRVSVQLSVTSLRDNDHRLVGYLGVAVDVAQLKM